MAKYVYDGWGPEVGPDGNLVRPGDEREFDEPPNWGRWGILDDPLASEGLPGNAEAPDLAAIRAAVQQQPPVTPLAATPAKGTEGGI